MATTSALPYLLMLTSSFSFAVMGALAHNLRESCDWQVISLARAFLQLLFALILAWVARVELCRWPSRTLWIRSFAGSSAIVLMFYAYTRIPVSDVIVLANTFPVWVAMLSWPVLGQSPSVGVWLAVMSSVLGMFLVQPPEGTGASLAYPASMLASLFTAIAYLALHRLQGTDPRAIIVHFSAVALAFCTASLFLFERKFPMPTNLDGWTLLQLLGVGVSAVIAQLLLTVAMAAGSATKVSVVGLTQIVFAMGFDVMLFGLRIRAEALLGIAMIVTPVAWLTLHRK